MNDQPLVATPGAKIILNTVKDELFPQIEKLRELLVETQSCRVSYNLYSTKISTLDVKRTLTSSIFFEVVHKLNSPDKLFTNMEKSDENMISYMQFQQAFKQNITEGIGYLEIIDRTLDRKLGVIQNNRIFFISIVAILISFYNIK